VVLAVLALSAAAPGTAIRPAPKPQPVTLASTIYYSGDIHGSPFDLGTIAVDRDGTVALAANRHFGPGNSALNEKEQNCVMAEVNPGPGAGFLLRAAAVNDLDEAAAYIQQDSPQAAIRSYVVAE
jgi:hypothetical protein